jgi:hypothetical protein
MAAAEDVARAAGCDYVELRQRNPLKGTGRRTDRNVATWIPTAGGAEGVFARLHPNVRNKIRKADKNEVVVQRGREAFWRTSTRSTPGICAIWARRLSRRGCLRKPWRRFPEQVLVYRAVRRGKTIAAKWWFGIGTRATSRGRPPCGRNCAMRRFTRMNWKGDPGRLPGRLPADRSRAQHRRISSHQDFKKYWGGVNRAVAVGLPVAGTIQPAGIEQGKTGVFRRHRGVETVAVGLCRVLGPIIARGCPENVRRELSMRILYLHQFFAGPEAPVRGNRGIWFACWPNGATRWTWWRAISSPTTNRPNRRKRRFPGGGSLRVHRLPVPRAACAPAWATD